MRCSDNPQASKDTVSNRMNCPTVIIDQLTFLILKAKCNAPIAIIVINRNSAFH